MTPTSADAAKEREGIVPLLAVRCVKQEAGPPVGYSVGVLIHGETVPPDRKIGFAPILEMSGDSVGENCSIFSSGDSTASWALQLDGFPYALMVEMDSETAVHVKGMFRISVRPSHLSTGQEEGKA